MKTTSKNIFKKNPLSIQGRDDLREELTKRETEVIDLIANQFIDREIGENLGIAEKTVEIHRSHILDKTHSKTMIGAVLHAIKKGYIKFPDV